VARTVSGDILDGFFEDASQVLNAQFKAVFTIAIATESCAKGHRVAAVPGIVNERIDSSPHAGQAIVVLRQFTLLSDGTRLSHARFVGKVAPD
jgi:hypothetical protein